MNLYDTRVCVGPRGRVLFLFACLFVWSSLGAEATTKGTTAHGFVSCCVPSLPHTSNPHEQETGPSWGKEDSLFPLKILWFLPHLLQDWPYQETNSVHRLVMLEKQLPKQVGGVAAALVRTRGPLRGEHKPLLHGPFPADTQRDHSPSPKPCASCASLGQRPLPYTVFIVYKGESAYSLLKV